MEPLLVYPFATFTYRPLISPQARKALPAMTMPASTSRFFRVLPDFAAFALGLSLAYGLDWQTTDLVWGLWLGSLVLGDRKSVV